MGQFTGITLHISFRSDHFETEEASSGDIVTFSGFLVIEQHAKVKKYIISCYFTKISSGAKLGLSQLIIHTHFNVATKVHHSV